MADTFSLVLPQLAPSAAQALIDFIRANSTARLAAEVTEQLPPALPSVRLTLAPPKNWPWYMLLVSAFATGAFLFRKPVPRLPA